MTCVALMYHTIYDNQEEWESLLDEEKPYAVSRTVFRQHLATIREMGLEILDPTEMTTWQDGVIITFDDGHRSHLTHALPVLQEFDAKALFFVSTALIEKDPRFCTWDELRKLHSADQIVHGHGHTHGFFADMTIEEAKAELKTTFSLLTSEIKKPWSMSFPGGRYQARDVALAKEQGFTHIFTSEIGIMNEAAFAGHTTIPRFAIKHTTDSVGFRGMINPSKASLFKAQTIALAKKSVKKLLGNRLYHLVYKLKSRSS